MLDSKNIGKIVNLSMNYVYFEVDFDYNYQSWDINVKEISKILKEDGGIYITLTDKQIEDSKAEKLYASVRFLFNGSRNPYNVVLTLDGESDCEEGDEDDEWMLDPMIYNYYQKNK